MPHLVHDETWGVAVTGVSRVRVTCMGEMESLTAHAARARAVGSHALSAHSSRSHAVFALYLTGVCGEAKDKVQLHGALHLVDLAGSERLDASGSTGAALKETQHINKSLSCLGQVPAAKCPLLSVTVRYCPLLYGR